MKYLMLYSDTFLWMGDCQALLYNSSNFCFCEIALLPKIRKLCESLLDIHNFYLVELPDDWLDAEVCSFLDEIQDKALGIVYGNIGESRLAYPPRLDLVQEKKLRNNHLSTEDVMMNVSSVTIYIGGFGWHKDYHKQAEYPASFVEVFSFYELQHAVSYFVFFRSEVRLLFSNLREVDYFHDLVDWLERNSISVTLLIRADEIELLRGVDFFSYSCISLEIMHDMTIELSIESGLFIMDAAHVFYVYSDKDCKRLEDMLQIRDKPVRIIPLYNGENRDFFVDNVFLTTEDMLKSRLSKQEIFIHQVMNSNYFGKFFVFPDGKIYSHPNKLPVGTLQGALVEAVMCELNLNYAWRRIRDGEECSKCIYRYLCPSPVFYEDLMGVSCIRKDKNVSMF